MLSEEGINIEVVDSSPTIDEMKGGTLAETNAKEASFVAALKVRLAGIEIGNIRTSDLTQFF